MRKVAARNAVARHEGVTVGEVHVIEVQDRQVGLTAKYVLDGQPGVCYHVLDGGDA